MPQEEYLMGNSTHDLSILFVICLPFIQFCFLQLYQRYLVLSGDVFYIEQLEKPAVNGIDADPLRDYTGSRLNVFRNPYFSLIFFSLAHFVFLLFYPVVIIYPHLFTRLYLAVEICFSFYLFRFLALRQETLIPLRVATLISLVIEKLDGEIYLIPSYFLLFMLLLLFPPTLQLVPYFYAFLMSSLFISAFVPFFCYVCFG